MSNAEQNIKPIIPGDSEQNAEQQPFTWQADMATQPELTGIGKYAERYMSSRAVATDLFRARVK